MVNQTFSNQGDLQDFINSLKELLSLLSNQKLKKSKQSNMPQGLPTSDSLSMYPPPQLIQGVAGSHSTARSSGSIVISKDSVLTSLSETLKPQPTSGPENSTPISLVIAAPNNNEPISIAQIKSDTTTTMSSNYHLTELVEQEKNILFQPKLHHDDDLELEPPRADLMAVRRRSRQFFTLLEEENSEDESIIPSFGEKRDNEPTVHVQPTLNLTDSLRRLYFPNSHARKQQNLLKKKSQNDGESEDRPWSAPSTSDGYESDPEDKYQLSQKILPALRKIQSHPELTSYDNTVVNFDNTSYSQGYNQYLEKTTSLPTTPAASPQIKRRHSFTHRKHNEKADKSGKSGPGSSFLKSVANEIQRHKMMQDKKLEHRGLVKVTERLDLSFPRLDHSLIHPSTTAHSTTTMAHTTVTASSIQPITSSEVSETRHGSEHTEHDSHGRHFTDFAGSDDIHSHAPKFAPKFVKNFIEWGTTKKIKVKSKETNVWSPTSF